MPSEDGNLVFAYDTNNGAGVYEKQRNGTYQQNMIFPNTTGASVQADLSANQIAYFFNLTIYVYEIVDLSLILSDANSNSNNNNNSNTTTTIIEPVEDNTWIIIVATVIGGIIATTGIIGLVYLVKGNEANLKPEKELLKNERKESIQVEQITTNEQEITGQAIFKQSA